MSAIAATLRLIQKRLDAFLKASDPRPEGWVILSNPVDHEGRAYEATRDKLVVVLAGIQHETVISTHNRPASLAGGQYNIAPPPIYINLSVLFLANFYDKSYAQGLETIASTIGYFQRNPVLTHENAPDLDPSIEKITMEMVNLDLAQTNNLMTMLGVRYLPAVLYRLRTLPFRTDALGTVVPAIL
jgi:hypothetical protein